MTTSRPKLLVFPGIDGNPELRQGLVKALEGGVEVQTFALPEDVSLDYEALAERLSAHMPDGPVVLAGESFSGPLVAIMADKHPEKVRGVIFIASFPRMTYLKAAKYLLPFIPLRAIPYGLLGWIMMGDTGTSEITQRMRAALRQLPSSLAKHRIRLTLEIDVSEIVSRLRQPVLVVHGRKDRLIPQGHMRHFLRLRPGAHSVLIDGHHMILETHPAPIAKAIEAFIKGLPQAGPG